LLDEVHPSARKGADRSTPGPSTASRRIDASSRLFHFQRPGQTHGWLAPICEQRSRGSLHACFPGHGVSGMPLRGTWNWIRGLAVVGLRPRGMGLHRGHVLGRRKGGSTGSTPVAPMFSGRRLLPMRMNRLIRETRHPFLKLGGDLGMWGRGRASEKAAKGI
jgi:hypothetical protein